MTSGDNSVAHLGWIKGPSTSRVSWGISRAVRTLGANVHLPYCARSNRKQLGSLFFIGKRTETHRIQPGERGLKISRNPVTLGSVASGTTEEVMLWRQSGLCTVMTVGTALTSKCPHRDTEIFRNFHSWGNFKLGDTYLLFFSVSYFRNLHRDKFKPALRQGDGEIDSCLPRRNSSQLWTLHTRETDPAAVGQSSCFTE